MHLPILIVFTVLLPTNLPTLELYKVIKICGQFTRKFTNLCRLSAQVGWLVSDIAGRHQTHDQSKEDDR